MAKGFALSLAARGLDLVLILLGAMLAAWLLEPGSGVLS